MERDGRLLRLVLKGNTMEILRLAVEDGLYPSQIASKLEVSKSSVVKKLNELEKHGIINSRFSTRRGSVVKRFQLVVEEFTLRVDLRNGKVRLEERRIKTGPTERIKELL